MERKILLNPGPATTTDTVKMAQVVPDICPREEEFGVIMREVAQGLLKIVRADAKEFSCVLFCGSGTLNMDVCLNSLLPAGKKALVVNNGAYSARAVAICRAYGLAHIDLRFSVEDVPDLKAVERALADDPDIALVYTTHHETGTGVLNPVREIGALAHAHGAAFVVDTTSTYAMLPFSMEEANIDFCMASAQKGLQAMTGLSFVIGRTPLIEASKAYPVRSYYCNLYQQYAYFEKTGQMQFTPPVQTIYAAKQALAEYFAEGEAAKAARHARVAQAIHRGLAALGLKEAIRPEIQSGLVVSVLYPADERWDFDRVHDYCYAHGFTIYPGKMQEKGTFRLCALGAIDEADIEVFFRVLKEALAELGMQSGESFAGCCGNFAPGQ